MSFILPYDECLVQIQNYYNCYVLYPNLVITELGLSKIHKKRNVNHYKDKIKWNINEYI